MKKHLFSGRFLIVLLVVTTLSFPLAACGDGACAHLQSTWVVEREATEAAAGERHLTCDDCGTILETEEIPALDPTQSNVTAALTPSMVKVIGYGEDGETQVSQGSGFFIDTKGTFITNAHVVKNCHFVQIRDHTGQIYNANALLALAEGTSDYAILSIAEQITATPVAFTEETALGSTVYALGFPNGAESLCVTTGELLSEISFKYYKSSAEIAPGNSGGALVDRKGLVIGITTSQMLDGSCMVLRPVDYQNAVAEVVAGTKTPIRDLPLRSVA